MTRKKQHLQRSRGRRPRHSSQWSSSSSSNSSDSEGYGGSSSSSEDSGSEMELEESLEDGRALVPPQHRVPDIDLWVPTRKTTRQSQREGAGHYLEHRAVSYTLEATQSHPKEDSTTVSTPEHALKVPLEKMLKLIRTRPTTQSHTRIPYLVPSPGMTSSAHPSLQGPPSLDAKLSFKYLW